MITKRVTLLRLPTILTAGVLSTGLLLSACSDNDKTANSAEDTAAIAEGSSDKSIDAENSAANQTSTVDTNSTVGSEQITDNSKDETAIDSDDINPVTSVTKQKSLVTNPTETGTPEDTVKQALDSLYYGEVKEAVKYYKVDMANFEEELAKTQYAFQQTVDGVTITDTQYSDDKTRATIIGELMLKGQSEPAPLTYQLQKIKGQWKILG
ncbi:MULTISPECIES: hypothetical protein [unclassified Psychrobacter]|jgi:hypothetical protein|uniref:hypothetical protein n=1 Tax=unclassified Psychrobacter TaxID=196806 RepID=UPI0004327B67|nr:MULTISPECIES: hypothetical protein [unclassified Psychrobacter]MCG3871769.1 hypothetical protein [Psychrobacter sp. Ps7]GAF61914.1 hypothetical protein JCM18903_1955 [Psychrobacter sp. JCM 18903]